MREVVIGMKDGKPYVVHCPRKVTVIIRAEKKRSLRKRINTLWWKLTHRSA